MRVFKLSFFALMVFVFQTAIVLAGSITAGGNLFEKGRTRLSLMAGAGRAFDEDYIVVGLGAGYFVAPGLEVGLDGEGWVGNSPNIYKLSPQVRYVFYQMDRIKPFLGTFYKRTYYEGRLDDLDSYGGRAGAFLVSSQNVAFGFGYVFEKFAGCDETVYRSCSTDYPEVSISVGF